MFLPADNNLHVRDMCYVRVSYDLLLENIPLIIVTKI
jgi:hypothetical protein